MSNPLLIKLCGNTCPADLALAQEVGADYAGIIIDVPQSPRSVSVAQAAQLAAGPAPPLVAVLLNAQDREPAWIERVVGSLRPAVVQLHGRANPELVIWLTTKLGCRVWKVLHLEPPGEGADDAADLLSQVCHYEVCGVCAFLLDTAITADQRGGTGIPGNWEIARQIVQKARVPVILSGGLDSGNVAAAISQVRPAGVDVASGVEAKPGRKDPAKVRAFVTAARQQS